MILQISVYKINKEVCEMQTAKKISRQSKGASGAFERKLGLRCRYFLRIEQMTLEIFEIWKTKIGFPATELYAAEVSDQRGCIFYYQNIRSSHKSSIISF